MDWLNFFFTYTVDMAEAFIMLHFFAKFIDKKVRIYHYLLFAVISILAVHTLPVPLSALTFYTLLLLLYGKFLCRSELQTSALYAILTAVIMQLCFGISKALTGIVSPGLYPLLPDVMGLFFMVFGSLTALLLSCLCCLVMYQHFAYSKVKQNKYILITFIPVFLISLLSEYINNSVYSSTVTLNRQGELLYANHWQMLTMQLFGVFSLFCTVYAYKKLVISFKNNAQLSMLEQETHFQNQYVLEAKSRYEKTIAFRHDMKNHFVILRGFLNKNQIEKAGEYLESLNAITRDLSFPCHTNNPVLDILMENKLGLAKHCGISVSCSLELPYPCPIKDLDFCILLSNALDNAIHACEAMAENSKKWIHILGRRQGDFFFIEIKNSCKRSLSFQEGIGLSNIRTITEKYNGALSIGIQDDSFCFSVLLIIPQQSESSSQQIY